MTLPVPSPGANPLRAPRLLCRAPVLGGAVAEPPAPCGEREQPGGSPGRTLKFGFSSHRLQAAIRHRGHRPRDAAQRKQE